jgi:PAS domain-containing protein
MNRPAQAKKDSRIPAYSQHMRTLRARNSALAREAEQLSAMLRAAPVGIALLNRRLQVLRSNAAMDRVAGGHLVPGSGLAALSPLLAQELEPLCRSALNTGQPQ